MDLSDEHKLAGLPQTIGLRGIILLTLSELACRCHCTLPKAPNSNLTRPFNGPFSKMSTRSVDRP